MKKILSLLLCILLVFSFFSAFAEDTEEVSDKIEITFKVGDSTLLINGKEVTVETPYIAGEGTTLVPLRVITEAFGAEVLWEGETKTITLNYPDVTIVLQIDNKTAKVNDHTEELAVAPTLSASGVTMVPLRFISETFGAEVSYDNGLITVTKASLNFGTIISSLTDKEKIGDSYQEWTMNTPKDLILADKTPKGNQVIFTGDEIYLSIAVKERKEDYSPEAEYIEAKNLFAGNALLVDTYFKFDENGNGSFLIQLKDDTVFTDIRCHATDKKVYLIAYITETTDKSALDSLLSIADSFKPEAVTDEVYDISEVKDGLLPYKNEKLKLSIMYPTDYAYYEYSFNYLAFCSDTNDDKPYSEFRINVFSVTDKVNAKSLAETDRASRLDYFNPEYSLISEITEFTENDTVYYQYTHEIKNTKNSDSITTDVFFEKGAYLYNICFYLEKDATLDVEKILKTLKVEELDVKEIGNIIRNENDPEIIYPVKNDYWTVNLPSIWSADEDNTVSESYFVHQLSDSLIYLSCYYEDKSLTDAQFAANFKTDVREMKKDKVYRNFSDVSYVKIDGTKFYTFTYDYTEDEANIHMTVYSAHKDGITFNILFSVADLYYTEKIVDECKSIINNFRVVYSPKKDIK